MLGSIVLFFLAVIAMVFLIAYVATTWTIDR